MYFLCVHTYINLRVDTNTTTTNKKKQPTVIAMHSRAPPLAPEKKDVEKKTTTTGTVDDTTTRINNDESTTTKWHQQRGARIACCFHDLTSLAWQGGDRLEVELRMGRQTCTTTTTRDADNNNTTNTIATTRGGHHYQHKYSRVHFVPGVAWADFVGVITYLETASSEYERVGAPCESVMYFFENHVRGEVTEASLIALQRPPTTYETKRRISALCVRPDVRLACSLERTIESPFPQAADVVSARFVRIRQRTRYGVRAHPGLYVDVTLVVSAPTYAQAREIQSRKEYFASTDCTACTFEVEIERTWTCAASATRCGPPVSSDEFMGVAHAMLCVADALCTGMKLHSSSS